MPKAKAGPREGEVAVLNLGQTGTANEIDRDTITTGVQGVEEADKAQKERNPLLATSLDALRNQVPRLEDRGRTIDPTVPTEEPRLDLKLGQIPGAEARERQVKDSLGQFDLAAFAKGGAPDQFALDRMDETVQRERDGSKRVVDKRLMLGSESPVEIGTGTLVSLTNRFAAQSPEQRRTLWAQRFADKPLPPECELYLVD